MLLITYKRRDAFCQDSFRYEKMIDYDGLHGHQMNERVIIQVNTHHKSHKILHDNPNTFLNDENI